MYDIVTEIRRFADEEADTIGRDVLRRELHHFADRVREKCDAIVAHYQRKVACQAAVMAETARSNVRLRSQLETAAHPSSASAATPEAAFVGVDLSSKPSETVYHVASYTPEMGWWCEYQGTDEKAAQEAYAKAKRIYDKVTFEKERK